jgi:hypothetical protein
MSEGAGAEGAVGFGFMVIFFFFLFVLGLGGYYVFKKLISGGTGEILTNDRSILFVGFSSVSSITIILLRSRALVRFEI